MAWQLCIRYPSGQNRVLRLFRDREAALRCVDTIYARLGYPVHVSYVVEPFKA
ncbi:family 2 glycosyl transferase [Leptolyngbya sp. FACHB-261]|uniref:family 2 glycosyl transferase n=1 Tax=Leptolyngbya sp. FACHB-261 TaxID=2692806 RepID=UPI001689DAAA|nr:family 2 glycosyl transferase [Leptolyngbya sp. FACHB-261]MBD2104258.1 family 2 glycosyl transferase [Leptolyngbya sp. FACHB-261]